MFSCIIAEVGFQKYYSDHSDYYVFIHRTSSGTMILVYIDNILLTVSDVDGIEEVKDLNT